MNTYLSGIKDADNLVLKEIYDKYFPILRNFVVKNNGTVDDAKDCFQEALVATFRRLQREDFEIKTTFSTYIFSVGKFIWFKKVKQRINTDDIEDFKHGEHNDLEEALDKESKYALFIKGISALGEDCQKVLKYYFARKKFKEIAQLMNYKSDTYARRKKLLCTKALLKIIKQDSTYKMLYNNI